MRTYLFWCVRIFVKTSFPFLGLSAWRWGCASPRCGSMRPRSSQRKQQTRTSRQSALGSDLLRLKCQINLDIYSPKDPDFCPAALLRRTSVFAAGENLGAGRIHSARACKIKGWRPPPAARTQKERHDVSRVFLFGAGKGNRTLIFSLGS